MAGNDDFTRAQAMLADAAPIFEEMADVFETAARAARAVVILHGASIAVRDSIGPSAGEAMQGAAFIAAMPHLETTSKCIHDLLGLKQRVEAFQRKHRRDA